MFHSEDEPQSIICILPYTRLKESELFSPLILAPASLKGKLEGIKWLHGGEKKKKQPKVMERKDKWREEEKEEDREGRPERKDPLMTMRIGFHICW